jgi:nucleoid DNA-binding protein
MNKKSFIREISDVLKENNIKKPMRTPKKVFHITDDEGNSKDFVIKATDKSAIFTTNDIENIIDAAIHVIEEALKSGDEVNIHGFGNLHLIYRQPRTLKAVGTEDTITVDGHYIPKFSFGNDLKLCAKMYELSLVDSAKTAMPAVDSLEDGDF